MALAFASQASAVLRPLFPIKPAAPFNGDLIVIGDELVLRSAKQPPIHPRFRLTRECLDTLSPLSLRPRLASVTSRKDLRAQKTRRLAGESLGNTFLASKQDYRSHYSLQAGILTDHEERL
jgi:hypothetical protein